ncbi:MAG: type IV pilus twitching motility protein PilT [Atribacterota bacterium]
MEFNIQELLQKVFEKKASDLHLTVGVPPVFRIHGQLSFAKEYQPLRPKDTENLTQVLLGEERWQKFLKEKEADFSLGIPNIGRFRVNTYFQRGSIGIAIRALSYVIPSMEELHLPKEILQKMALLPRGLILVTGPTGSGKSTTLASMIDYVNENRSCHIITIEDPIEYLHTHKKSIINQREVGADTPSFESALVHALREDPDVILVGEMRNLETIAIALTAAETGHLVMATLHTNNAPQTIDRIVDVFPPHQQTQIRIQLAGAIQGIVAQQLLPLAAGQGRIPAIEVMIANNAIRNLIREGKTYQIYSVMQTSLAEGMITMDRALFELYKRGLISWDEAYNRAIDPKEFATWRNRF